MDPYSGVVRMRPLGRQPEQWCPQWYLVFLLLGLQGAKPLEVARNLHLKVTITGPKIEQKHVDSYAFFMCIAVQSHRKIQKGPKF